MYPDKEFEQCLYQEIFKLVGNYEFSEFSWWSSCYLNDKTINEFTKGCWSDYWEFCRAIKYTYSSLYKREHPLSKGRISYFEIYVVGKNKDKILLGHMIPLTEIHKSILENQMKVEVKEISPNLAELVWKNL
jgi:hypothetical protein